MRAFGGDRFRVAAGKLILHSPISKDWTARVPATLTHSEHPGTTVHWDEQYFEVISAEPLPSGDFRYVLGPWPEEHTIRQFVRYDEESEALRQDEYRAAERQRRHSLLASLAAVILGHLPEPVQNRLANDLGIQPDRMTLASCLPSVALLGTCVWLHTSATLRLEVSPVPETAWLFAVPYFGEAAVRFLIAMSQGRGAGSLLGYAGYALFYYVTPNRERLAPPFERPRGERSFTLPPSDEVALRDSIEMRELLFSLLPAADQKHLAAHHGYDYRRPGFALAWIVLIFSVLGVVTSIASLNDGWSVSALISALLATILGGEQIVRLIAMRHSPVASLLAPLVRPFVRDLLERG
jgi:hypothetical protein